MQWYANCFKAVTNSCKCSFLQQFLSLQKRYMPCTWFATCTRMNLMPLDLRPAVFELAWQFAIISRSYRMNCGNNGGKFSRLGLFIDDSWFSQKLHNTHFIFGKKDLVSPKVTKLYQAKFLSCQFFKCVG